MSAKTCLIIGIGNLNRGDDGLGPRLIEELRPVLPDSVSMIVHDGEPASLIESWQNAAQVYLVDAVYSGAEAGSVFELNLIEEKLPEAFHPHSTHGFGVSEAVELARTLGRLPEQLVFLGVEGSDFGWHIKLSPKVEAGLEEIKRKLMRSLLG